VYHSGQENKTSQFSERGYSQTGGDEFKRKIEAKEVIADQG